MWREMSGKALMTFINESAEEVCVFFYVPTCGNCKTARRLIDLALSLAPNTVISTNMNLVPQAAALFKIERLPAFYVFKGSEVVRKRYDFPSPAVLAEWMKSAAEG